MKKIIIVGAGGFGRELLQWIKDINMEYPKWEIAGFIDDDLNALDNIECSAQIIGRISDWQPKEDEEFALAIGSAAAKRKIAKMLKDRGAVFADVIHPTAILAPTAHHGEGFIMFPHAKLSVNSNVGNFVTLLTSGVGHDVQVGDYTTISGMCSILRNVVIGREVFVAAGVQLVNDIRIGDGAYLGLGSVILKDIPSGAKAFGNPARIISK